MEKYKRISIVYSPGQNIIENDYEVEQLINKKIFTEMAFPHKTMRIINVQHYTEPAAPNQLDPYSIEGVMIIVNIAYTV